MVAFPSAQKGEPGKYRSYFTAAKAPMIRFPVNNPSSKNGYLDLPAVIKTYNSRRTWDISGLDCPDLLSLRPEITLSPPVPSTSTVPSVASSFTSPATTPSIETPWHRQRNTLQNDPDKLLDHKEKKRSYGKKAEEARKAVSADGAWGVSLSRFLSTRSDAMLTCSGLKRL